MKFPNCQDHGCIFHWLDAHRGRGLGTNASCRCLKSRTLSSNIGWVYQEATIRLLLQALRAAQAWIRRLNVQLYGSQIGRETAVMCQKCWEDADLRTGNDDPPGAQYREYLRLLKERTNEPCTPDEQKYGNITKNWEDDERDEEEKR